MPPAKKRECSVILFDVNSDEEFKKRALKCYADICGRKFFQESPDLTQLILVNTSETQNSGNDEYPDKYKHIVEATEMLAFNPTHKKLIEEAQTGAGNWLEGILLAIELLEKIADEKGIYTLQLLLFSDLKTPLQMKEKLVNNLLPHMISKINEYKIYLFILGPEVDIPFLIKSKADIRRWTEKLQFKDIENTNTDNLELAKRLVQKCSGVMCDLETGTDLFTFYKNHKGKQPWLVPLTVNDLEIPAVTSKILVPSARVNPTPIWEGTSDTIYVDIEDETNVLEGEFVSGLVIYGQLVMIPLDIDKAIKEGDRYFKLIGFTDARYIPPHIMKSTATNVVLVDEGRNTNAKALEYVIRACHKLNYYGVAQKVHMKNCLPKLFCLIPEVTEETVCFLMPELEYAEGYIADHIEDDIHAKRYQVKETKLNPDVAGFLDSKDATNDLKLHPNLKADFYSKKMFNQFTKKFLGEEISETVLDFGNLYKEPSGESYEKMLVNWKGKTFVDKKNNPDE